jgi:septal ring factor EnvC (AmiA/AmiB activator)
MASKSEVLHHVDEESHQTLKALKEAFRICADEGQKIKSIAEEDSMITQELEKEDRSGTLPIDEAKGVERELADVDRKLKSVEEEAEKLLEELDAARKGIEQEMEEIREMAS